MKKIKASTFTLEIHWADAHYPKFKIQKKKLQKYIQSAAKIAPKKLHHEIGIITLIFVDIRKIQELNSIYRNIHTPTDVLSFEIYDEKSPEKSPLFGEIYICLSIAKVQAEHKKCSIKTRLNILFVHGLLHLFGFDHENDHDLALMKRAENSLLKFTGGLLESEE